MHKKKAKILVIGTNRIKIGDAAAGKSTLVQAYAKKNYQFSSDYSMVSFHLLRPKGLKSIQKLFPSLKKTLTSSCSFSTRAATNSMRVLL